MRAAIRLLLPCVVGCSPADVLLTLPVEIDARALIVVLMPMQPGGPPRAFAIDPAAASAPIRQELTEDEALDVYALYHREPLAELGLAAGDLPLSTGDTAAAEPDPAFAGDAAFVEHVRGGAALGWARVDPPPAEITSLQRFREPVPFPPGCDRLALEWARMLPVQARALAAKILEDGRAIVVTRAGLYLVDPSGPLMDAPIREPLSPPSAAFVSDDGSIWLALNEHRLAQLRWTGAELAVARLDPPHPGSTIALIDGASTATHTEIFTADGAGLIERWNALDPPLELARIPPGGRGYAEGGLARIGPQEVLLGVPFEDAVVHITGTTIEREATPIQQGLSALENLSTFGVVAVSGVGGIIWRRDARWIASDHPSYRLSFVGLGPSAPVGFWWGGLNGRVGQYRPETGHCPVQATTGGDVRLLVPWGPDHFLYANDANDTSPGYVVRARLAR